jgi:hypothetical protein
VQLIAMEEMPPSNSLAAAEPIADTYNNCLGAIRSLIRRWHQCIELGFEFEKIMTTSMLEEYGRIRTWGEESHAALPDASQYSLHETLRQHNSLHSSVAGILQRIIRQAEYGM